MVIELPDDKIVRELFDTVLVGTRLHLETLHRDGYQEIKEKAEGKFFQHLQAGRFETNGEPLGKVHVRSTCWRIAGNNQVTEVRQCMC